jgi:dipicolinate synthase subunit B
VNLSDKTIGFALTGSHCTLEKVFPVIEELITRGAQVIPILSESVQEHETRFGSPSKWKQKAEEITGNEPLTTIPEVEPIGPEKWLDILIVAPCTGNTTAKIANGITDTCVTMAVKAHLRNGRPVVLAVATNDALSNNACNLGAILDKANVYLVPLGQDKPLTKPNSMVARMDLIVDTAELALQEEQLQPVIIEYKGI